MKNVTITLDEEVARRARIRAAERETSVSRLVGEMLRERMLEETSYQAAMQEYLSQKPRRLKGPSAKYPKRKDLQALPVCQPEQLPSLNRLRRPARRTHQIW